jgi:hypothetical protein
LQRELAAPPQLSSSAEAFLAETRKYVAHRRSCRRGAR